jgi:hypothetical protein
VVSREHSTDRRMPEEKGAELFGKDIIGAYQGSLAMSSSGVRAGGISRKLQSVR